MQHLDSKYENIVFSNLSKSEQLVVNLIRDTNSILFGGYIRDKIANFCPNDFDIIATKETKTHIVEQLTFHGFEVEVRESSTYILDENTNKVIVQSKESVLGPLIILKGKNLYRRTKVDLVSFDGLVDYNRGIKNVRAYMWMIPQNVDFRACSLAWSKESGLVETIDGGLNDCLKHFIIMNKNCKTKISDMKQKERIEDFIERGWIVPHIFENEVDVGL